ncbi:hypothetical protein HDA40_005934 [Hamadaea flava]|uniref:DUF3800 domain-containing protein n=1 Tax=Hamadaea flava TaxID=1742688 RepID=A0ABV8LWG7_9ACTN|nr:DUF3800 domain-containing protein [Hamadaea flava]MCP2327427.1 hypothetical protein [Hamadaea flava]
MHLLYLDESGGVEPPDGHPSATPAMIVLGVIVDADVLRSLTFAFMDFKREYFPARFPGEPSYDDILNEIKGARLLHQTRSNSRDSRRHADHARTGLLELVSRFGCQVVGRVWIKRPGERLDPDRTYTDSVWHIASQFSRYLERSSSLGFIYADGRSERQDRMLAHSIFTAKHGAVDDPCRRIPEVLAFADSRNHAGIQIADMLASMITLPIVTAAYGASPGTIHDSPRYAEVREKHGNALQAFPFRYFDETGRARGGIVVSDAVATRPSAMLFGASGFGAEVVSEGELEITIPVQAGAAATAGSVSPAR